MCGICGAIHKDGEPVTPALLEAMNNTIIHRGPDGEGYLLAEEHVGLAMRRLSIIDIGGSDQPLFNEDKSIGLVFNGEIYNFRQLREDLIKRGHTFRTDGDGETIAHLYEEYGDEVATHLEGQFAFALWDSNKQRLLIARDRFGQKPLYYYHSNNSFVFASEIKAILTHPRVPRVSRLSNPEALAEYLGFGYIPAPDTAFEGIKALPPASYLIWQKEQNTPFEQSYWNPPYLKAEYDSPSTASEAELINHVQHYLRDAVEKRLIADVPLGAFLSGGLDSSLIVALMQQISNRTTKTFSIGFAGDTTFDETSYAEQVAQYLGTEHTAFTVEPHAIELLPKLVWHHDQPFADSSAIPTYLVSELTKEHVTVALTGDGGDEQFAGYERFYAALLIKKLGFMPQVAWQLVGNVIGQLPEGTGYYNTVKRAGRFARAAGMPFPLAYFDFVRVCSAEMIAELTGAQDVAGQAIMRDFRRVKDLSGLLDMNQRTYLPDDLNIKTDRMSMAASLEARSPFLDHNLAEYAAEIPSHFKLNGSNTKYILKEAARGLLPDSIIDRKKHGFGAPLGAWLRDDISLVREILLDKQATERGLFKQAAVEQLINEHESGQRDNNRQLWTLLTLESWHQQFIDNFSAESATC